MSAKDKETAKTWILYLMIVIVILLWASSYFIILKYFNAEGIKSFGNAGSFGDMFGAVNALFSGLAFAGLIYALYMQRKELRLQREELALQRKELELTRGELNEQNITLKCQRFENTFFHMLSLHNELVESCTYEFYSPNELKTISGRNAISNIYSDFQRRCETMEKRLTAGKMKITPEHINKEYMEFYKGEQHNLGHYFRNMYNIVKFVKNSSISEKRLYTNLLRAQLSTHELALLFYNCLSDVGDKFKPLVEEFALLKNLPKIR